ncbi:hypothetical protein ACLB2K_069207 [Fragaria x ananassa]
MEKLSPNDLPFFLAKFNKAGINDTELEIPLSFSNKYMVEDNKKHGSVHLDGYNRSWEVSVRRRHDFVVLGRGWKKFVRDVIQDYEMACIVFEYKGYMSFTIRAFYDDGNIVVDVPLNMSHLSQECLGGFSGPGPEFLMPITSVAGRPMINAHGPFYRRLVEARMGQFQFRLKSYPWIRDDVELTSTIGTTSYLELVGRSLWRPMKSIPTIGFI